LQFLYLAEEWWFHDRRMFDEIFLKLGLTPLDNTASPIIYSDNRDDNIGSVSGDESLRVPCVYLYEKYLPE
jgi:hypothetical protein